MQIVLGGNIKSRGFFFSASFLFVCLFFGLFFFFFSLLVCFCVPENAVRKPNGQSDLSTPLNRKLMIVAFEIKLSPGLKSQLD